MKTCLVKGCDKRHRGRGACGTHYRRMRWHVVHHGAKWPARTEEAWTDAILNLCSDAILARDGLDKPSPLVKVAQMLKCPPAKVVSATRAMVEAHDADLARRGHERDALRARLSEQRAFTLHLYGMALSVIEQVRADLDQALTALRADASGVDIAAPIGTALGRLDTLSGALDDETGREV